MRERLQTYYYLTKPGIIYGNLLTAAAGFFLAAKGHVNPLLLLATLLGTSLVIASACVFNNYIDRGLDQHMARTKERALVQGKIGGRAALVFAAILGLAGAAALIAWTNTLVVLIGLVAFIDYVVLYGITKRRSVHGTLVGGIAGAAPLVAGYVAVTHRLDLAALVLFVIMMIWQMPHFYAIAMYRLDDYRAAGLPVFPLRRGLAATRRQIVAYVGAYLVAAATLTVIGITHYVYLLVMTALGLYWFQQGLVGLRTGGEAKWARQMFGLSLIVLVAFCAMISIDWVLI